MFFPITCIPDKCMGVIDLQGVASLDSRGLIGRIYVVEH